MKKHIDRLRNWLKNRWKWYVLGYYHCDKCPYSWEEWSYECDCDAGCYIKGDIYDTCRLIPPFRAIIGWFKMNAYAYGLEHEYDGFSEWMDSDMAADKALQDAIHEAFSSYTICRHDTGNHFVPVSDYYIDQKIHQIRQEYEGKVHPVVHKPLKQQWKELILDTWKHSPIYRLAPYFYNRKKRRSK